VWTRLLMVTLYVQYIAYLFSLDLNKPRSKQKAVLLRSSLPEAALP